MSPGEKIFSRVFHSPYFPLFPKQWKTLFSTQFSALCFPSPLKSPQPNTVLVPKVSVEFCTFENKTEDARFFVVYVYTRSICVRYAYILTETPPKVLYIKFYTLICLALKQDKSIYREPQAILSTLSFPFLIIGIVRKR